MFERMLDKAAVPVFDDLLRHCGEKGILWMDLDRYLKEELGLSGLVRFPYGNKYGWGVKYSKKSRHICDVFAEKDAFTAHFQIADAAMETVLETLGDYAKQLWADKYPCSGGGWIHFRVLDETQLPDLKTIIRAKVTARSR